MAVAAAGGSDGRAGIVRRVVFVELESAAHTLSANNILRVKNKIRFKRPPSIAMPPLMMSHFWYFSKQEQTLQPHHSL